MSKSRDITDDRVEEFPELGEGKNSIGKAIPADGQTQAIGYPAPEGFKYEFGYDKERDRSGYILMPLEKKDELKAEPKDGSEAIKRWQYGDDLDPDPLLVQSFLSKPPQTIIKFPVLSFDVKASVSSQEPYSWRKGGEPSAAMLEREKIMKPQHGFTTLPAEFGLSDSDHPLQTVDDGTERVYRDFSSPEEARLFSKSYMAAQRGEGKVEGPKSSVAIKQEEFVVDEKDLVLSPSWQPKPSQ